MKQLIKFFVIFGLISFNSHDCLAAKGKRRKPENNRFLIELKEQARLKKLKAKEKKERELAEPNQLSQNPLTTYNEKPMQMTPSFTVPESVEENPVASATPNGSIFQPKLIEPINQPLVEVPISPIIFEWSREEPVKSYIESVISGLHQVAADTSFIYTRDPVKEVESFPNFRIDQLCKRIPVSVIFNNFLNDDYILSDNISDVYWQFGYFKFTFPSDFTKSEFIQSNLSTDEVLKLLINIGTEHFILKATQVKRVNGQTTCEYSYNDEKYRIVFTLVRNHGKKGEDLEKDFVIIDPPASPHGAIKPNQEDKTNLIDPK